MNRITHLHSGKQGLFQLQEHVRDDKHHILDLMLAASRAFVVCMHSRSSHAIRYTLQHD